MAWEINQPGSIGVAPSQRELIHPQDLWGGEGNSLGALPPHEAVTARPISEQPGDPCGHLRTAGVRQCQHGLPPAFGLPSLRGPSSRKGFDENPARARWGIAEEPPGMHHELDRPAPPRHIPGLATVATVHTRAQGATQRTGDSAACRLKIDNEALPYERHLTKTPSGSLGTKRFETHGYLPSYGS